MSVETIISFLAATALVVVVPGPNILLIVNDSIKHGFGKSLFTVAGISTGMALLFSLSIMGVTSIFIIMPWLFDIIKTMGVCYLLYLGCTMIYSSLRGRKNNLPVQEPGVNNFFMKGFFISISNPKGLFFAGAFFPQFLTRDGNLIYQSLVLCGGCLLVATIIGVFYAYLAGISQKLFNSSKFSKRSEFASGIIFLLLGFGLFFTQKEDFIGSK